MPLDAAEGRRPRCLSSRPPYPPPPADDSKHVPGGGWPYPLVATPDNFGKLGRQPTHPELLDYLATQFVKEGW